MDGSGASAGMAWMSPKRRGRAQRRLSGKTQLVRGQLNFGLCPAPRPNCQRKNCCSGRPDHARGHPNSFCGGAHHVGCVKGLRLRTSLRLRRDSSLPWSHLEKGAVSAASSRAAPGRLRASFWQRVLLLAARSSSIAALYHTDPTRYGFDRPLRAARPVLRRR